VSAAPRGRAAAAPLATSPRIRLNNHGTMAGAALLDALVTNSGRLVVGEAHKLDSTQITGDFRQTEAGRIVADLDLASGLGDRLAVDGNADLTGGLQVAAVSLLPGRTAEVLTVDGTIQGELQAIDSLIFDYELGRIGDGYAVSVAKADFEGPLANRSMNERRLARYLQAAWDLGGTTDLAELFADLDNATGNGIASYGETLYSLTLGVAAAPAARGQAVMQDFADSLFSCPTFADGSALVREGSCIWAQVFGGSTDQDAADGADGFSQDGFTYQLGMQNELSPGWYLGVSAAYREDSYDGDNGRAQSSGDSALAGITVKRQQGPWLLGLGLSGSYGWYDTSRTVALADGQAVATSEPEVQNVGMRARAAYDLGGARFYLRPALDLDTIYTRQPSYRESGADGLDLVVDTSDQWALVATPSLELGGRIDLTEGWMFRPYLRGGVSFANQSSWSSAARLAGAPDDAGSFATEVPIDEVVGRIDAGLQVLNGGDVGVRVQYDGEFSGNVASHGGSLRVDLRF
jgi:outer membrane autotransporter protein